MMLSRWGLARCGLAGVLAVLLVSGCASVPDAIYDSNMKGASAANTQLGISYMQRNNLNLAMESLTKAVSQDAGNAEAHASLAVLQERLDMSSEADRSYRQAIRLDQGNSSYHNNYGRFLCSRDDYRAAQQQFELALKDPLYQRRELPLANAGLCALQEGKRDVAEDYLRRALEISPTFTPALMHMAELQLENADHVSAIGYFERYRERARLNAQTLWLGIRIEHALDNRDAVSSLGLRLRADYPDSKEAQAFRRLVGND